MGIKLYSKFIIILYLGLYSIGSLQGQTSVTIYPDIDTYVNSNTPTTPNGASQYINISNGTYSGVTGTFRSIVKFDLSSIPTNAIIESADFYLYGYAHDTYGGSNASWMEKCTGSWVESTVTWNTKPGKSTTDRISLPASTSQTQNYPINVKNWVQSWVNGSTNNGFTMSLQTEAPYRKLMFYSSDYASDPTKHPKLVITYRPTIQRIIGTGTLSTAGISSPFSYTQKNKKSQFLFFASELAAQNMEAGRIYSIAFNMALAGVDLSSLTLSIGETSATSLSNSFVTTPLTQVYSGAYSAYYGTGWREVTFTSPYNWNGTSNIVIQVCYAEPNDPASSSAVYYTQTPYQTTVRGASTSNSLSGCSLTDSNSPTSSVLRPNTKFKSEGLELQYKAYTTPPSYTFSASSDQNYIHTVVPKTPVATISNTYNRNPKDVIDQVSYFDGLGRPLQEIDVVSSPKGESMLLGHDYDDFGREAIKYLPFTDDTKGLYEPLAIEPDPSLGGKSYQELFYDPNQSSIPNTAKSNYAYSETIYDGSPLNRILQLGAPGEDWQPNSHSTRIDYQTNSQYDVLLLSVGTSGDLRNDIGTGDISGGKKYYKANELYKSIVKDENWVSGNLHTSSEFKDKQGRVVLKRNYVGASATKVETYYVYDDFGLLRYVIAPSAVGLLNFSVTINKTSTLIKNLCYYYEYDERQRMVLKQLPGADAVYMVYDLRDRLVLTQDGIQRSKTPTKEWTFYKYDVLNRPILTGIYLSNSDRSTLQTTVNTYTGINLYEERKTGTGTAHGYTYRSFPTVSTENSYLSITYYDDYDFKGTGFDYTNLSDNEYNAANFDRTLNKVTGTKVRVLGRSYSVADNLLQTVNYYDKYGNTIQTIAENHLGGKDIIANKINFEGELLKSTQKHTVNNTSYTYVIKRYVYDHRSRLLELWYKVGASANLSDSVLLSSNRYNELGQLMDKSYNGRKTYGYSQSVDYRYNIRGWLTKINDIDNLTGEDDLFAMDLLYNSKIPNVNTTGAEQYNGNITAAIWKEKGGTLVGYGYGYDELSRITEASYGEYNTSWVKSSNKFNVSGLSYDVNGNILKMNVDGLGYKIDDLTYTYTPTSNKLINVNDLAGANESKGFYEETAASDPSLTEYTYDLNGNMYIDNNKGFTVQYNSLNLPQYVYTTSNSTQGIEYLYSATGQKVAKVIWSNGNVLSPTATQHYIGNFVYDNNKSLRYIITEEGRILKPSGYVYEYSIKDHLGNARAVFEAGQGTYTLVQRNDYYPFGSLFERGTVSNENKYLYNGKELQDDFIGTRKLDWYDYGARMYDPQIGRWHTLDPLAHYYYKWSPYHYAMNNPIRFTDVLGMGAGDFYDERGKYLGTDGKDDGRLYVVTDKQEKKQIQNTDKAGGTTSTSEVSSSTELPSSYVRGEMSKAVDRAGSPSFHEEGGFFGTKEGSGEYVVHAEAGEKADPSVDPEASVNVFKAANKDDLAATAGGTIDGTFHTHPDGTVTTGTTGLNTIGGTTTTSSFANEPSNINGQRGDIPNARANTMGVTGNSYVLAQGNKTVYIYNGSGTVATFPFKQFFSIGIKK